MNTGNAMRFFIAVLGISCFLFSAGCLSFEDDSPLGSITQPTTTSLTSKIQDAIDYTNPITRDFAVSQVHHSGKYNIAQICDLWESIGKRWTYVNDPNGREYFSPASHTIAIGLKGDCDDFAIVTASAIKAVGGASRIILTSGHAYPEVSIASSESNLNSLASYICKRYNCKRICYHTSTVGGKTIYWLNLDWSAGHPGGPFTNDGGYYSVVYPK